MTSQREIGMVAAVGSAILALAQIGSTAEIGDYPESAYTQVQEALRVLREAQRGYLPPETPAVCTRAWVAEIEKCPRCGLGAAAHSSMPTADPDAYDDDSRWKR